MQGPTPRQLGKEKSRARSDHMYRKVLGWQPLATDQAASMPGKRGHASWNTKQTTREGPGAATAVASCTWRSRYNATKALAIPTWIRSASRLFTPKRSTVKGMRNLQISSVLCTAPGSSPSRKRYPKASG